MDDLDQRLRACVAAPAGEFDADDVARRAVRLRRRRRLASALGVALVLAVVALGTVTVWDGGDTEVALDGGGAGEPQTFARPEAGEVVAMTAPDGEPAFLVGREDGATAFRAVEPLPSGMRELVVWCEPAQAFVTPFALSEWTMDGHYLGGPAPGDLVSYQTDLRDGQVIVGEARARPDRTPDATPPPGDPFEACRAGRESTGSSTTDTVRSLPIDPDVTVSHAHREHGDWPPVEQALAAADEPTTIDVRLTLTGGSGRPFRACSDPAGDPPRCPADAPVVDGLDRADEEFPWLLWRGYARVATDGTTITGFDYWVTVTQREGESRRAGQRQRELEPGRSTLYCRVPGHRDAGMEVDVVGEATP